jgi:hypothetical protein
MQSATITALDIATECDARVFFKDLMGGFGVSAQGTGRQNEAEAAECESRCCHQMEPAGSRLNLRLLLDASGSGGLRCAQSWQKARMR